VDGGQAAPEIIVIHGRQVVVNQRIAVDQLDCDGRGNGQFRRESEHPGGFPQQEGSGPLAAVERAVAHGRNQTVGRKVRTAQPLGRQQDFERPLDLRGVLLEFLLKGSHGAPLPETGKNH